MSVRTYGYDKLYGTVGLCLFPFLPGTPRRFARALMFGLAPLLTGLALPPGAGSALAQDTTPTLSLSGGGSHPEDSAWRSFRVSLSGATLTASDIEDTTATLTIAGHTGGWWYEGRSYWGSSVHSCTAVAAGTTAVSVEGLTAVSSYDYLAYSDSTCNTRLARVKFRTLAPEGTPTVSVFDRGESEDGTWMRFRVSLSHASREQVTVDYRTSSGTATSGTDFRAKSGTMTFSANSGTPKSVWVRVYDDEEPEPDETFTLTLTNPTGATLGDATATGTIRDDGDTDATLSAGDIEDTTATLTIAGHTDGWWYKGNAHSCTAVAAGTTSVGIGGLTTVTDYEYLAYSDSACGTKLAKVKFGTLAPLGTPTVSVSDAQEHENGSWIRFKVSLSQASRNDVTVEYTTSNGTATGNTWPADRSGFDFEHAQYRTLYSAGKGTLTFPANRGAEKWISVTLHDDAETESDETFTLTLESPVGATLGDATAVGTIRDDETRAALKATLTATLTASHVGVTTAKLTIGGHTGNWWYKGFGYKGNADHPCTAVAAGTTAVGITGLAENELYEFDAYSDSTCTTLLAAAGAEFETALFDVSSVRATYAVLDLFDYSGDWWYKGDQSGSACTKGYTDKHGVWFQAPITGLTAQTTYTYRAYAKAGCNAADELDSETFTTPAAGQASANTPARGAPGIAGEARVSKMLTASTDEILDPDGLEDTAFGERLAVALAGRRLADGGRRHAACCCGRTGGAAAARGRWRARAGAEDGCVLRAE